MTEALLAFAHLMAILMMATFLASQTALCRPEWINPAVLRRLVVVDGLYWASTLAVLATGLTRSFLGIKSAQWYWAQPLLHGKVTLLVLIALMSLVPTRRFLRWHRDAQAYNALPSPEQLRSTRRLVMLEAHLIILVPLLAVMLARGIGTR